MLITFVCIYTRNCKKREKKSVRQVGCILDACYMILDDASSSTFCTPDMYPIYYYTPRCRCHKICTFFSRWIETRVSFLNYKTKQNNNWVFTASACVKAVWEIIIIVVQSRRKEEITRQRGANIFVIFLWKMFA